MKRPFPVEAQVLEDRSLLSAAYDDTYSTAHNAPLLQTMPGVLANDTPDYDEFAMPLPMNAALVSGPDFGTLNYLNPDGSFEYIPPSASAWPASWTASGGTATFTYAIDGGSTATVTISVTNTAPSSTDDPSSMPGDRYTVGHNQTLSVMVSGVLSNDTDADMESLEAFLVSSPSNGTLTFRQDGSFDYTPNPGYVGQDSFTYRATDGIADGNVATVKIDVTNSEPTATDDLDFSVIHDRVLSVSSPGVLGNDYDMDGDSLTAILVDDVTNGTLTLNSDGSFTYTPNLRFVGTDSFTYRVNDGIVNSTGVATVTIDVTNQAPVAVNDDYQTEYDTPLLIPAAGVLANDSDYDGDTLTAGDAITFVLAPPYSINTNGSIGFTPPAGFTGVYSFPYKAFDGITATVAFVNINVRKPVVSLDAPTDVAKEVGPVNADFTLTRTGGTANPLTVKLNVSGSADAADYDCDIIGGSTTTTHPSVPTTITFPANVETLTIRIKPVMDTTIEGKETVVLQLLSNTPNNYDLGTNIGGVLPIRDRAGVLAIGALDGFDIRMTAGQPPGTAMDVTDGQLHLIQGDTGKFVALPTAYADWAPNEPTWTMTGEASSTGIEREVTFSTFVAAYGNVLSVSTPANPTPKTVSVRLVPHPTAITATAIANPTVIVLPTYYGTDYVYTLTPSTGATVADLDAASADGFLKVGEKVTFKAPYASRTALVETGCQTTISGGGKIKDEVHTYYDIFPLTPSQTPSLDTPVEADAEVFWKAYAPDSRNTDGDFTNQNFAHHFHTVPTKVSIAASANGWTVTTEANSVPFVQPYSANSLYRKLTDASGGSGIPVGGTKTIVLVGSIKLTAADVTAGTKTFALKIWDDDYGTDTQIGIVYLTVPTANGVSGMATSYRVTTLLNNSTSKVAGNLASSLEQETDIYFEDPDGFLSDDITVRAD